MKDNMKQIEQIINLQKEIKQLNKQQSDNFAKGMMNLLIGGTRHVYDDRKDDEILNKKCVLKNLVNNLTKKKMRILIYKLLEEIK